MVEASKRRNSFHNSAARSTRLWFWMANTIFSSLSVQIAVCPVPHQTPNDKPPTLRPTLMSKEHGDQDLDTLDMECEILSQVNIGNYPDNSSEFWESTCEFLDGHWVACDNSFFGLFLHTLAKKHWKGMGKKGEGPTGTTSNYLPKLWRVEHCVIDYSKRWAGDHKCHTTILIKKGAPLDLLLGTDLHSELVFIIPEDREW